MSTILVRCGIYTIIFHLIACNDETLPIDAVHTSGMQSITAGCKTFSHFTDPCKIKKT